MKDIILGQHFIDVLVKAEVIPMTATKVIIEAEAGGFVYIHYSLAAEKNLLDVLPAACEGAVVKSSMWDKVGSFALWRKENGNGNR